MSQYTGLEVNHRRPPSARWNTIGFFAVAGSVLFLTPALHAQEKCPAEVKLLLSPATPQTVTASLGFGNETMTRVYMYDTDALDLLMQGVIVRVRQGAKNDLTVKIRVPAENQRIDNSRLGDLFPCEIDRTRSAATTSYAVARKYVASRVPETGNVIYTLFNASQVRLLHQAQVSIDWARVTRIADIHSTRWETAARPPSEKLALELWEWPGGTVLELSARVASDAEASKLAELERLVKMHNLPLSSSQDSKTGMVLETLAKRASPPR